MMSTACPHNTFFIGTAGKSIVKVSRRATVQAIRFTQLYMSTRVDDGDRAHSIHVVSSALDERDTAYVCAVYFSLHMWEIGEEKHRYFVRILRSAHIQRA